MIKGVVLVAALLLAAPATTAAQVNRNELNLALLQLQRSVERLGSGRPARLAQAVQWLQRRATTTDPAQVSPEYVRTLTTAATLLGATPTPAVIDDITEELEAKVDHCRALGIGMGGSVLLRVNTRRGADAVGNWQVFYLLKVYEASGSSPATFATLSTPAQARLDPGRYWVWARDPATGRTSGRALLRVSGSQELRVDLPVP